MARSAFRRLKQRLESIAKGSASGASLCEQVLGAMRDYLGDKFSTAGSTLTTADVVNLVADAGAQREAIDALRRVMSSCEAGAYAGDNSVAADREAFIGRVQEAAQLLEKTLK
jgi:hypothetical protein